MVREIYGLGSLQVGVARQVDLLFVGFLSSDQQCFDKGSQYVGERIDLTYGD